MNTTLAAITVALLVALAVMRRKGGAAMSTVMLCSIGPS